MCVIFGYKTLVRLPVHAREKQLLDTEQAYPCPSCKHGELIPITLTDAWGCDRCKQIFELRPQPNTIGKVSTPYPRQRTWHWNGQKWQPTRNRAKSNVTDTYSWVKIIFLPGLLWLIWTLSIGFGLILPVRIALILLVLVVMFWLVLRR